LENSVFNTESFPEAQKNKEDEALIDINALKQIGKFESLELLAVYDLNFRLIRLDGFEQRSNCGISYRWYFENNKLIDLVQIRHGFNAASDELKNVLIKEILQLENGVWQGKRDITKAGQKTNETISAISESKVNVNSYRITTFLNPSIYYFANDYEMWSSAFATNFDFSQAKTKYYYNCVNDTYKIQGRFYTIPGESMESAMQIRFEVSGGKLKYPQQISFHHTNYLENSIFENAKNGLLSLNQESFCMEVIDVNFDGYKDLSVYSLQTYCFYIFNPEIGQFEFTPVLKGNQIEAMSPVQNEKKVVWIGDGDYQGPEIYFIWDNGFLRRMNN